MPDISDFIVSADKRMAAERERLVRVEAPHFVAGMIFDNESKRVTSAAPILSWAVGRHVTELRTYCGRKGWKASVVRSQS